MPTPRQEIYKNKARGTYVGRFYFPGKPAKRINLCTISEAEIQILANGKTRQRTAAQEEAFVKTLYHQKFNELEAEKTKEPPPAASPMVRDVMQKWLDEVAQSLSPKTNQYYLASVNYYIKSVGNHPLDDFQKSYKLKLLEHLKKQGMSPQSIKIHITHIQRFFNWALEEEYTERYIKLKKPSGITKKKPSIYTVAELKEMEAYLYSRFEKTTHSHQKRCLWNHIRIFTLAKETAFRAGEIWSLKLSRIDLDRGVIELRSNPDIGWKLKTREEVDIPISNALAIFLRKDFAERSPNEIWFLDSGHGSRLYADVSQLTKAFARHLKAMGIQGIKPLHGIRATVITMVSEKFGVLAGRDLARHSSITTTDAHYIHLDSDYLKRVVDSISSNTEPAPSKTDRSQALAIHG